MDFIPNGYLNHSLLFVNSNWTRELIEQQSVPSEFPKHSSYSSEDIFAILKDGKIPKADQNIWEILRVDRYPRKPECYVLPLLNPVSCNEMPCFDEVIEYVSQANFTNIWRESFKKYSDTLIGDFSSKRNSKESQPYIVNKVHHDAVLLEAICRFHNCPVIDNTSEQEEIEPIPINEEVIPIKNCVPAIACIVTPTEFIILSHYERYSLQQMLRFSPCMVENSYLIPLFIVYQILIAFNNIHKKGLTIGDINLDDIVINDDYYVALKPNPLSNVIEMDIKFEVPTTDDSTISSSSLDPIFQELLLKLKSELNQFKDGDEDFDRLEAKCQDFLGHALHLWMTNQLSNFDYILFLNYLSGRTFSNPNHYPVMPWVKDFTSQNGGWRDLSKSKYRLNKGDTQLDLTFEKVPSLQDPHHYDPLSQQKSILHTPHHVSDVLSEITYYVYKARRTSQSILCKYVRNRWVPAEYPSSMQRLVEWTPDESIPEFFTDPNIFTSIHHDLSDLGLPSWCNDNPQEFIQWHRQCLESPRVSERLHSWIDLTFGYKLSGSSAIRAKNVCLNLVDNHTDLRDGGVIQLFNNPHPSKMSQNPYWDKKLAPNIQGSLYRTQQSEDSDSDSIDESTQKLSLNEEPTLTSKSFALPKNYDALSLLNDTEQVHTFAHKSNSKIDRQQKLALNTSEKSSHFGSSSSSLSKKLATRRKIRDMQVLGCLIMELFLPKKYLTLGSSHANLISRYKLAIHILKNEPNSLPHCIRATVQSLLLPPKDHLHESFGINDSDRYPTISDVDGLPPPSASQLLIPTMSTFDFPSCFEVFSRILRVHKDIEYSTLEAKRYPHKLTPEVDEKIAETIVKTLASDLLPIVDDLKLTEIDILMPRILKCFNPNTSIMMAWLTFEPLGKLLGPSRAIKDLLQSIVNIYENNSQTSKHLKLYHRTFLGNVMVRFTMKVFLKYFTENIVEAVGGYKDFADRHGGLQRDWTSPRAAGGDSSPSQPSKISSLNNSENNQMNSPQKDQVQSAKTPNEEFAEGEVFAFDNEEENGSKNILESGKHLSNIEKMTKNDIEVPSAMDMTAEILLDALANRDKIGKLSEGNISQVAAESVIWLTHRLGPVLTAKYLSKNLLKMLNLCYIDPQKSDFSNDDNSIKQDDFVIRIQSIYKTNGDILAHNVLECLKEIACIYGENFILYQYFPYAWDLISLGKRKLSPNLEGGLIGSVTMVHQMIPLLSDSVLMNELTDNFMSRLLFPVLQLSTSRSVIFYGGPKPRKNLLGKLLDVAYLIGLRIGEDMARTCLSALCAAFFGAFDKIYDSDGNVMEEGEEENDAIHELTHVLTPDFAFSCYVAFYHLIGRAHLDMCIPNLNVIKLICSRAPPKILQQPLMMVTFAHLRISNNDLTEASSGGNKILSSQDSGRDTHHMDAESCQGLLSLIKKEMKPSTRHLKGNWWYYWEHEIGRSDETIFNMKQIKLQTFVGHNANVKSLYVLDNENSFLSASRDRTVKVWSLRSQGDGSAVMNPQWSYSQHKKSTFFVTFLAATQHAASCDSTVHVWDPFVGTGVHQVDPVKLGPVSVITTMRQPASTLLAATQHDSLLHMIDCRTGSVINDMKVCMGSAGLIRCLSAEPDEFTITVGHSSGSISQLDIRTGKLRQAWKAHEGEILSLTPLNREEFVSTSLDQVMSVWNSADGKMKCMLPGAQEPVHCVSVYEEGQQLITGSTGNRIGVRKGFTADSPYNSCKIKSDILKGNLTSMKLLPMNRLLLLGEDTGKIRLLC